MSIDGARMKQRRKALGLTQAQLADATGIAQETISRLEGGHRAGTRADTQESLARALKTSVPWLRGEIDDPDPAAGGGVRVDREPQPPVEIDEPVNALEDALGQAFDNKRHTLRDVDAVRECMRDTLFLLRPDSDTVGAARKWLDAAASLRKQGVKITPQALLVRVTFGKDAEAQQRAEERDAERTAELDAQLRAEGIEPGAGAAELRGMLERQRKKGDPR